MEFTIKLQLSFYFSLHISRKTVNYMSINILLNTYIYTHVYTTNCGKFLKRLGIPYHLTHLLRNLYPGQEATVRTRNGTMTGSKLGKE